MRHFLLLNAAVLAIVGICGFNVTAQAGVATFDDLTLSANSYWNGSDQSGTYSYHDYLLTLGCTQELWSSEFNSGDGYFNNNYSTSHYPESGNYPAYDMSSWDGWAYSSMTDTTTPGYANEFSAITGQGFDGSPNYGVGYCGSSAVTPISINFSSPVQVQGMYVTNTTYAYLSMLNGDSFAKQFGGDNGTDEDWFKLTIIGYDAAGTETGTVDFYLADYRFADSGDDYIVDEWTWIDLTSLDDNVSSLGFSCASTDNHPDWGMNTPAYFAMDNLTVVPEPSTFALLVAGLLAVLALRRRK